MALNANASTALVFPGQGSQCRGMAMDYYEQFSAARATFDEASDALSIDVAALCFGDDPRLDLTEFTQPALLTAEIAMYRVLEQDFGLKADYFGGHSLGEYTALCAAGVLGLSDAVKVVARRGALMQSAVPMGMGSMVAVIARGVAEGRLTALLKESEVDLANRNSPNQVVLSGDAGAVARAIRKISASLQGDEERLVTLNVSAPFHSRMMKVIEGGLREVLQDCTTRFVAERAANVTSNLTGGFHQPRHAELVESLVLQASSTVDWIGNMRTLSGLSDRIIEVGPGRTLRTFFQQTLGVEVIVLGSVRKARKELLT